LGSNIFELIILFKGASYVYSYLKRMPMGTPDPKIDAL
jgi:hypothetical protein